MFDFRNNDCAHLNNLDEVSGKNEQEISMPLLEHGSVVSDGIDSVGNFCSLRGEGLEPVEIGLEHQAFYRCIYGKIINQ